MNHIYSVGDNVITTRGHVGQISKVIEGVPHIEISPEFAGFDILDGVPQFVDGQAKYIFSKEGENSVLLTQGEDFDFKNNDRYVVKFQKNERQFHPASLRLFDRPYTVNTIQTPTGQFETHIECEYHTELPNGPIISTEIRTPQLIEIY